MTLIEGDHAVYTLGEHLVMAECDCPLVNGTALAVTHE